MGTPINQFVVGTERQSWDCCQLCWRGSGVECHPGFWKRPCERARGPGGQRVLRLSELEGGEAPARCDTSSLHGKH